MTNYKEIIQKNINKLDEFFVRIIPNNKKDLPNSKIFQELYDAMFQTEKKDFKQWHTQSLISYLEEENKRLEESKKVETRHDTCGIDFDTFEGYCYNHKENITTLDKPTGATDFNQAINEQVEHNKNVIKYLQGL